MFLKRFINNLISPSLKLKGENNKVDISQNSHLRKVKIKIYGNNNTVNIGEGTYLHNVSINIGFPECPINDCRIEIKDKTSINSADIQLGENNSSVDIGEDCMLSFNVEITCSDTHSILDLNNNLQNIGKNITIGSHVWICKDVKICKNTQIPDNCIVAQGSIVTKVFTQKNSVIAGNPARVVKNDIKWDRSRPQEYLNRQ